MKKFIATLLSLAALTACRPNQPTSQAGSQPIGTTVTLPQDARVAPQDFDWKNALVYYAMTDRFYNGNLDNDESYGRKKIDAKGSQLGTFNGGDFAGLTQKIREGYFTDLGVTALWISAPYEQIHGFVGGGEDGSFAHYGFHGYYPLDWTMTDPNFGTQEEFKALVDEAHKAGIRVVLDVVMNHTGYNTVKDMAQFGFGDRKGLPGDWQPKKDQRYDSYHELVDYQNEAAWQKWWGKDWVRAGLPGYDRGGTDDFTMTLSGLPDIKTESQDPVDLPPVLKTKWQDSDPAYELPNAKSLRQKKDQPPAKYIEDWLVAWVENYGIDGFRIDTAKHVELKNWTSLKARADEALKSWRQKNPDQPGADFKDDFYFFGEVWGAGLAKNEYHEGGFDALINFTFQGEKTEGPAYDLSKMGQTFSYYAKVLKEKDINILTYISSHDTKLFPRKQLKDAITFQMLLPGAIQTFYGDESARPYVSSPKDLVMGTRGPMNWASMDKDLLNHYSKLANFRKRNPAVGAGTHSEIQAQPLIFARSKDNNQVVIAMKGPEAISIPVNDYFKEGSLVREAYTGQGYRVVKGQVQIEHKEPGIILLEAIQE